MKVKVELIVNVPDDLEDNEIELYLNDANVEATHPADGDIYVEVRDYTPIR
jgi:hypothetical protein